MSASSWDDMKRVRESEFFHREEQEKKRHMQQERDDALARLEKTNQSLENYQRGFSPLQGASMFRSTVAGQHFLDCPEEGVVLMSYSTLLHLISAARKSDSDVVDGWDRFIKNALHARHTTD